MKIHVIGVGKMGMPMAQHLQQGGHAVTVQDSQPERRVLARDAGLEAVDGLAAADVILSSLPHDAALVIVGGQVAQRAKQGAIYVDTSTASQAASAQVAAACAATGVRYLRATVSGNNKMAEAAQLTVMASGPRDAYDTVLPLLRLLGPTQFYLGGGEEARLMKLVINLMVAQTSAMLAEALALGRKGGLQWEGMWAVIATSAVASPLVQAKAPPLAQRDFTPTFTVEQMVKDVRLILDEAAASHVPLPQAAATLQLLHAAIARGWGGEDYAAIIKTVEHAAGLETFI